MFDKLFNSIRRERAKARAVRELRAMGPRLLLDVGIAPDQIEKYVDRRLPH